MAGCVEYESHAEIGSGFGGFVFFILVIGIVVGGGDLRRLGLQVKRRHERDGACQDCGEE